VYCVHGFIQPRGSTEHRRYTIWDTIVVLLANLWLVVCYRPGLKVDGGRGNGGRAVPNARRSAATLEP